MNGPCPLAGCGAGEVLPWGHGKVGGPRGRGLSSSRPCVTVSVPARGRGDRSGEQKGGGRAVQRGLSRRLAGLAQPPLRSVFAALARVSPSAGGRRRGARLAAACCRSGSSLCPVPRLPSLRAVPCPGSASRSAEAAGQRPCPAGPGSARCPGQRSAVPGGQEALRGLSGAHRAGPSRPSFLLSGYLRTMGTVCACGFLGGNYSCMGRHFILPDLSSSPEGLFSSRLSSKRARDTAGKQSGAKQTFLVRITWIRPNFLFTCSATCEFL